MKLIAIASIYAKDNIDSLRVYDFDSCKVKDIKVNKLYKYKIRNIRIYNEKIIWKEGSQSRYPIMRMDSLDIKNKDNVTIIGKYSKNREYYYIAVNILGDIKYINEDNLIGLIRNKLVTNYKLSRRKGTLYTSAIGNKALNLNLLEPSFYLNRKTLHINMYYNHRSKIDIPNRDYNGKKLYSFTNIIIKNCNLEDIKYIKLPNCYEAISNNGFKQFKNLETIEYNGPNVAIKQKEIANSSIKKIIINSINDNSINKAFMGCRNIESIEYVNKPKVIYDDMYSGCTNLDCNNLIYEGIKVLDVGAFKGCKLESLTVPHSVRVLDLTDIDDTNIKSIELKRTDIYIQNVSRCYISRIIDITVPNSFPVEDTHHDMLNIIKKDITDEEKSVNLKLAKAKVLGLGLSNRVAKNINEIKTVLRVIGEEDWRNSLIDVIKIPSVKLQYLQFTVGIYNLLVDIAFIYKLNKIELVSYYTLENFVIACGKDMCYIYIINKDYILSKLDRIVSIDAYSTKWQIYLPSDVVYVKENDIQEVYEQNKSLYIIDKYDKKIVITI